MKQTMLLEYTYKFEKHLWVLTLRTLMSHICDVSPLRGSECVPSITKPSKYL